MKKELSLYAILRTVLSQLNEQVVEHGERVAFLYLKMAEHRNITDQRYIENMMLTCFAHDIGAYKTEAFLDLLKFDVSHTQEHCIYGYLFMKHFSHLRNDAKVLLYHHTPYTEMNDYGGGRYVEDGILIHFLDRIDIFNLKLDDVDNVLWEIKNNSGRNFNPKDVEDFFAVERKWHVIESLKDMTYAVEVRRFFNRQDRTDRLLKDIISMLSYEIDFKSEQTVIHTITTAILCVSIGEHFALSQDALQELELSAHLHDFGKIRIPTDILEKPGKLTNDEYDTIKKHVLYTELIIDELFPESIVRTASRHHERLDGSGYPYGLTADELTLQDRILQIADVASALIMKRSYKQAMEKEAVVSILQEEANRGKLDGAIVNAFCSHYDEIISDMYRRSKDVSNRYEHLQEDYKKYLQKFSKEKHEYLEKFSWD